MPLKITWVSGNSYRLHDEFLLAEADLLGGGEGMTVILNSIHPAAPVDSRSATDANEETLISHLVVRLKELNRFRSFVVARHGKVVASVNTEPTEEAGDPI